MTSWSVEWVMDFGKMPKMCDVIYGQPLMIIFSFESQVVDGTSCDLRDGLPRVCVEGECRPIGCDGMLGSQVSTTVSGIPF